MAKTATHLRWPEAKGYAEAFPDEIEDALRDQASCDFSKLSRLLPGIKRLDDLRPPGVKN